MEWRAIRIAATIYGKLGANEAEKLLPVKVPLPVIVRVGTIRVDELAIRQSQEALLSVEWPVLNLWFRCSLLLLLLLLL